MKFWNTSTQHADTQKVLAEIPLIKSVPDKSLTAKQLLNATANVMVITMSNKPSPSRIKFKADRKAKRLLDPIVQEKARRWAKIKEANNDNR